MIAKLGHRIIWFSGMFSSSMSSHIAPAASTAPNPNPTIPPTPAYSIRPANAIPADAPTSQPTKPPTNGRQPAALDRAAGAIPISLMIEFVVEM